MQSSSEVVRDGLARARKSGATVRNFLEVRRPDFVSALKKLRSASRKDHALLAFEGGYLSIEVEDRACAMHATGEWHGRARFSANVVRALAESPPAEDPIMISFRDGSLRISTMMIACRWETVSKAFIRDVTAPDYLDLVAMDRSLSRAEIRGTGLNRKIATAKSVLAGRVAKAAKLLEIADITEGDLWNLVEQNVRLREAKGEELP